MVVFAALQYWWSLRLSEATAVRLADSLQMSMTNWQTDLFRELLNTGLAIRTDSAGSPGGGLDQYARHLAEWRAVSRFPDLIAAVDVVTPSNDSHSQVLRLRAGGTRFESTTPGALLANTITKLEAAASGLLASFQSTPDSSLGTALFGMQGGSSGWRFDPVIPALLHPVIPEGANLSTLRSSDVRWVIVELNPQALSRLLGELAQTYFRGTAGLDYQIAVLAASSPKKVIYSSDAGFGEMPVRDADGVLDIFGRADSNGQVPVHLFHAPSDNGNSALLRLAFFPRLSGEPESSDWQLIVRHRRGGALGSFIADMRKRDLAISLGVLVLIGVNLAMLIVTSQRARRLAQLQMNFVTAVSHELRTPLTVIMSGADNISDGVVETKEQMKQYGAVIATQARQLFELVERILLFASTRQGRHRFDMRPLDVREVVEHALAHTSGLIQAGDVALECEIDPELPTVVGDASALSQCLQNLITNALKYGRNQRWLRVRASKSTEGDVEISVSDKGIGIGSDDLPHIFEPFYRSPAVRAAQIRGTGLGLPLSKSIAEAMKGRLTVSSVPGQGSTFTLHLPAASPVAEPEIA